MEEQSSHDYVKVYTANGPLAGEMIRGFLQAQGIPAMVIQESAGAAIGLTIGKLGEVQIFVPKKHQQEAETLLEEMEEGEFSQDDDFDGMEVEDDEEDDEGVQKE